MCKSAVSQSPPRVCYDFLMESNRIERALADRLFDGVVEIDGTGQVTLWNPAAERITGFAADKVLGRHYQQQPARQVNETGAGISDLSVPLLMTLHDGIPREALGYFNHADGYRLTTIVRTAALYDSQGRLDGAIQVFNENRALIAAFRDSQKTEQTVLLDPLTGIGNRTHIEMKLRSAIEEFRAHRSRFGLLFIDIDHFKDFNDNYGHLLGDKILRIAANTIRQNLRATDSCGRWGGEEFLALVRDLDGAGLAKVAEKLRATVATARVRDKRRDLGVTISIGACLARPDDTLQSLIDRADQLMYESKRLGRNRVTLDTVTRAVAD